jgi:polyhydroxybutyrate depolymerase
MHVLERTIGMRLGSGNCAAAVCAAVRQSSWTAMAGMAALLAAAALVGVGQVAADDIYVETRDGTRRAIVLPRQERAAPTIIVLHGAATTASLTANWSGFAEAAAGYGFAAVFPQGIFTVWNDGRRDGIAKSDDVGFVRALVGKLIERNIADPRRIYLAGISNGGMLALRMLCEHPAPFAGAAAVVASMPALVGATCRLEKPMPVIMFNGTADPVVPYNGGTVGMTGNYGQVWSAERTAAFLAWGNGCQRQAEHAMGGSNGDTIRVVRLDWQACRSGHPVALYRVEGGGHQVFGATNIVPMILGPGTSQVSAPEVILAEFAKARP